MSNNETPKTDEKIEQEQEQELDLEVNKVKSLKTNLKGGTYRPRSFGCPAV